MDIHEKIIALRKVVPEKGATEDEALNALSLANKLMEKYSITEEDLRNVTAKSSMHHTKCDESNKHIDPAFQLCGVKVAKFCEVKVWSSSGHIEVFGLEEDVAMYEYLMSVLVTSMKRSWQLYLKADEYPKTVTRHVLYWSFRQGFADSVNKHLDEMIKARTRVGETGTDLIILKQQIVEDAFKEEFNISLRKSKSSRRAVNGGAYADGVREGSKVNLNRPLNSADKPKVISPR